VEILLVLYRDSNFRRDRMPGREAPWSLGI
jgi:hypothetical protein